MENNHRKTSITWLVTAVVASLIGAAGAAYFSWLAIPLALAAIAFVAAVIFIFDRPWIGVALVAFFLPFERIGGFDVVGQTTLKIGQVFALATVISWILYFLIVKKRLSGRSPVVWLLLAYLSSAALSCLNAVNLERAGAVFVFTLFVMVFALTIPQVVTKVAQVRKIVLGLLISAGLIALFGLYQFGGDVIGLPPSLTGLREQYTHAVFGFPRIHSTALEPLYLANYLLIPIAVGFMIWISQVKRTDEAKEKSWLARCGLVLGIVIVSVLALVLTLSRGGYLGLAATAVVLIILGGRRIFTRRNIIPMVGIVAVVAVGLVTFLNFSGRFSLDVFWKQATEYQQGVSVEERYSAYDQAVKLFAEHPVIGVGVGNFGPRVAKYAQVMPKDGWAIVNNESLELLAETGIFGFAAIAGLMVLVVGRAGCVLWRARQTEVTNADIRFLAAVLGGLLAALVGILVQYQTFSTLYILHVWFVVGMMEAVGSTMRNLIPK